VTRDDEAREREIREEIEFHLGEDQEELEAAGKTPADARWEARRTFGNPAIVQEDVRDVWVARWLRELRQDLHFGVRSLMRSPAFLAATMLCLALGIGATTAVFSVANAIIVRSLPYADADRLLVIHEQRPGEGVSDNVVSYADYFDWREQQRTLAAIGAWEGGATTFTIARGGDAERVPGAFVTAGFFDVLAVAPRVGRTFALADEDAGSASVVVVTDRFWRRALGAAGDALGRPIVLDGREHTVVGILPAHFEAPFYTWEIFVPLRFDAAARGNRGNHSLNVLARLHPEHTLEQARADMDRISKALEREHAVNRGHYANVVPMTDALRGELRPATLALVAAVALVMLIACFNVANLLIARALSRDREMAVRLALGAGWGRLLRQLLAEGLLLSFLGAGAGVAIAGLVILMVRRVVPAFGTLNPDDIRLDGAVLGTTLAVALVIGMCFGLGPAFSERRRLLQGIRFGMTPLYMAAGNWRRSAIVVAQTALAVTLLIGAGLLLRSFWTLQAVDPGFETERVMALRLRLPSSTYGTPAQIRAFQHELLSRVGTLPGVTGAGMTSFLPMAGEDSRQGLVIEGVAPDPALGPRRANWRLITPGYIETLRIPLIQGRLFDDRDGDGAPLVMLVNETAARRYWPGRDPVGHRARLSRVPDFATVVGVVGDVKHQGPEQEAVPEAYLAFAQYPFGVMSLVVRTNSNSEALMPGVRRALRDIDSTLAPVALTAMDAVVERTYASRRFLTFLVLGFATLALVLAMCGVYAQLAYAVSQRTRDIGVRMALGAPRAQVVTMVVRQGLTLAVAGAIVGLAGAAALSGTLQQFLFGIHALDLQTLAAVPVVLVMTAMAACTLPAMRAARISPAVTLRQE